MANDILSALEKRGPFRDLFELESAAQATFNEEDFPGLPISYGWRQFLELAIQSGRIVSEDGGYRLVLGRPLAASIA